MTNIIVKFDAEDGYISNHSSSVNVYATYEHKGVVREFKPVSGRVAAQVNIYSYELAILESAIWSLAASFSDANLQTQRGLEIHANTEYQLTVLRNINKWVLNGYTNAEGKPLKNQLLLQRLNLALNKLKVMVTGNFVYK